jgi:hypothetical protein
MRTLRQRGWASAALAFSATLALPGIVPLHAEEKPVEKPAASALGAALQMTRTRGVATVAVLTSAEQPASVRFWKEFYEGAWARTNRGVVELVNVSKDTDPGLVRTLDVRHFPTAIVYTRGPQGVRALGMIADCDTVEDLVTRLRSLDLGINAPAKADQAVTAAAFSSDNYPSGQTQCPAPTYCPPVTTAPQPQPTMSLSLAPAGAQSLQATANVIQVPSQHLMIQQAPPQVFLAPAQAPIVYVPQTMAAAPTMTLSAAPAPSAPAGNLFLATPTLAASPAQQPTMGLAVSAPAPAPAATLALAAGPTTPLAVTNNQTLSLPTSGSRTRVRVRGPGMLASSLARLGERMTRLGRSRIETVQETTLEAPFNPAPSVGMATISTTSTQPLAQAPTLALSPPQQPCQTSCPASPPPSNLPSPQKQSSHDH